MLADTLRRSSAAFPVNPIPIGNSTTPQPTAYSSQRKIDRCQNGVLWTMFWDGGSSTTDSMDFYYSTDDGKTWALGSTFGFSGTAQAAIPFGSIFIDLDDYIHVVYQDRNTSHPTYRRGTPNAARTEWTWSGPLTLITSSDYSLPDIVAHREFTYWRAHVVLNWRGSSSTSGFTAYCRIDITSAGALSVSSVTSISNSYTNTVSTRPSIDFNHIGDGKTVINSTPHLYVGWNAGAAGTGMGMRFKKAVYSAGAWTWNAERDINTTHYVSNTLLVWMNCLFDGTRVIFPGFVYVTNTSTMAVVLHERDAADTTTTTRTLMSPANVDGGYMHEGSASYDTDGNVYFIGRNISGPNFLSYRRWVRLTNSFNPYVTFDLVPNTPCVSAKRGFSKKRIEFVYTYGTLSPYNVKFGGIS